METQLLITLNNTTGVTALNISISAAGVTGQHCYGYMNFLAKASLVVGF